MIKNINNMKFERNKDKFMIKLNAFKKMIWSNNLEI
jgi:hypothetical protein